MSNSLTGRKTCERFSMWPFRKNDIPRGLDERLRVYTEKELKSLLSKHPSSLGNVRIAPFEHSRVGKVRLIEIEGYGKLVARMFNRKMDRYWASAFARLSELLDSNGIRTARVLLIDQSPRTWQQYGFSFLAEEFLDGRTLIHVPIEGPRPVVDSTADLLLRLHAIRSLTGGKPWEGQTWKPERRASEMAREHLARLQRLDIGLGSERSKAIATWFAWQFRLCCQTSYPIVHGDFHGENILVLDDGSLGLIDLTTVSYGFPQVDLVEAEIAICRNNATSAARLLARYFAASEKCRAISHENYKATRPVFVALRHIIKAGRRSRRIQKHQHQDMAKPRWKKLHNEVLYHWTKAEEALQSVGAP